MGKIFEIQTTAA